MIKIILTVMESKRKFVEDDVKKAEKDAELDTDYKRHDYAMKKLGEMVERDDKFNGFSDRDLIDAGNILVFEVEKKLKKEGKL